MFERITLTAREHRRKKAVAAILNSHAIQIQHLHRNLLWNIVQDEIYAAFPRLPKGMNKHWREVGPYHFKIMTKLGRHDHMVMIRIHLGGEWLGTFTREGLEEASFRLNLPDGLATSCEITARGDEIFTALAYLEGDDTASRTTRRAA